MLLAVADPEIGGRAMILPLSSFCPFPALPSIPVQSSPLNLTGRQQQLKQQLKQQLQIGTFRKYCIALCLQCFDAVGWAAGRASGL